MDSGDLSKIIIKEWEELMRELLFNLKLITKGKYSEDSLKKIFYWYVDKRDIYSDMSELNEDTYLVAKRILEYTVLQK